MKRIITILCLFFLFAGCVQQTVLPDEAVGDSSIDELSGELGEFDDLEGDMDFGELDDIESELEGFDW